MKKMTKTSKNASANAPASYITKFITSQLIKSSIYLFISFYPPCFTSNVMQFATIFGYMFSLLLYYTFPKLLNKRRQYSGSFL